MGKEQRISLYPLKFKEAVAELLKVPPITNRELKGGTRKHTRKPKPAKKR